MSQSTQPATDPSRDILQYPVRDLQPPDINLTVDTDATSVSFELSHDGPEKKLVIITRNGNWLKGSLSTYSESCDGNGAPHETFVTEWSLPAADGHRAG